MCSLNPRPLTVEEQAFDRIKWDRRVPLGKMLAIVYMGQPKVFGPGSAITEEMFIEAKYADQFYWPFDQEKLQIIDNGMRIPEGRVLIAYINEVWSFIYGRQKASFAQLKVGTIVDQTADAIDAAVASIRAKLAQ